MRREEQRQSLRRRKCRHNQRLLHEQYLRRPVPAILSVVISHLRLPRTTDFARIGMRLPTSPSPI